MRRKTAEDTIAAISTPLGEGGIGIVRISGPQAVEVVEAIFVSSRGRDLRSDRGRVFHGEVRADGEVLDEVLVHRMRAPHSYTREDVVEINCHGGVAPLQAVLDLVLRRGARLAEPGEFTKRAFLNGRIDLVQAEAVIDRIRAQTRAGLRAAGAAARGVLSQAISAMREVLVEALARIEAAVDFPEEDLPELVDADLEARLRAVRARIDTLVEGAEAGRLYREGARVAIAGRPNVGKSSLFNALLRDARAIVTAQPGTTRDPIEEVINIAGVPVRLMDTAGLRSTQDEVEKLGVAAARNALKLADAILLVLDASAPVQAEDEALTAELSLLEVPILLVLNKVDLAGMVRPLVWPQSFAAVCPASALTGEGLDGLEAALGRLFLGDQALAPEAGLVSRVHQRDSLRRAGAALDRLLANYGASPEFLSIDLREALKALGEITGETTPDDVLDRIFGAFCIGK